jgi:hypothetical protein
MSTNQELVFTREELLLLTQMLFPSSLRSEANKNLHYKLRLDVEGVDRPTDPLVDGLRKKIVDALNRTSQQGVSK